MHATLAARVHELQETVVVPARLAALLDVCI
jgi:hypothetical protein